MDMVVSSVDQSPLSASCFCLFKEVFSSPDAAKRTKFDWIEFSPLHFIQATALLVFA